MIIVCLQHASFEGPGTIASWAAQRDHEFRVVHSYRGERMPDAEELDLLVVMGGPMSVHDEAELLWLAAEKELVRRCLDSGKFILGVCLGSQLLAEALGARVHQNQHKEIGWFPVDRGTQAGTGGIFTGLPEEFMAFHWHGETYGLPPSTLHLARSQGCAIQAFEHPCGVGLQFHLEMTPEGISTLARECSGDIGQGPYEQECEQMNAAAGHCTAMERILSTVLDRIELRINAGTSS